MRVLVKTWTHVSCLRARERAKEHWKKCPFNHVCRISHCLVVTCARLFSRAEVPRLTRAVLALCWIPIAQPLVPPTLTCHLRRSAPSIVRRRGVGACSEQRPHRRQMACRRRLPTRAPTNDDSKGGSPLASNRMLDVLTAVTEHRWSAHPDAVQSGR